VALALAGCGGAPRRSPSERLADSAPAVAALQGARFADATREATLALGRDRGNSRAAAVRAIAGYQAAGTALLGELERIMESGADLKALDHAAGRAMWQRFADALGSIDRDLAVVAADPQFSLELCLACWEYDWNRNGTVDDGDRRLFELENDGRARLGDDGDGELPQGDPRRRPTFRFDTGDAEWARAMMSFQRAGLELILAYRWTELDLLFRRKRAEDQRLVIPLQDAARVPRARQLIIEGLGYADRCRASYLAETDDDREWVPSPRQQSYPMTLAVDAALYQTWEGVIGDLRRMLESQEGLSLRGMFTLTVGDDEEDLRLVPDAFVDLGAMLREPSDITIDFELVEQIDAADENVPVARQLMEKLVRGVIGKGYSAKMAPTPLLERLARMRRDLETGNETFERKLRYLFWLN
jgi:hypothetical protein